MPTDFETIRRAEVAKLTREAAERAVLETRYGDVWNTDELRAAFDVEGFLAPYVVVRRKADGVRGSLRFQHAPRYYFEFEAAK